MTRQEALDVTLRAIARTDHAVTAAELATRTEERQAQAEVRAAIENERAARLALMRAD